MTAVRPTLSRETLAAIGQVQSREQFSRCLGRIATETGATHYLLLVERHVRGASRPYIVASNWIFDSVLSIGPEALARFAHAASAQEAVRTGQQPCRIALRGDRSVADGKLRTLLRRHGHEDLHALPIRGAAQRCHLLISAGTAGAISERMLPAARLAACYLLARPPAGLLDDSADEGLSERERECLYWVAEGKTAGEVAMILGVTANTVNSYLNHAIRKVGASNRAMAVATAIRSGVI